MLFLGGEVKGLRREAAVDTGRVSAGAGSDGPGGHARRARQKVGRRTVMGILENYTLGRAGGVGWVGAAAQLSLGSAPLLFILQFTFV